LTEETKKINQLQEANKKLNKDLSEKEKVILKGE
jgi:hypothetical protein